MSPETPGLRTRHVLRNLRTHGTLRAFRVASVLWVGGLAGACGTTSPPAPNSPPPPAAGVGEPEAIEALFWSRLEDARGRFTEADVHFMSAMIGHHAQAVVMADLAPERAESRAVRILAARIRRAQEDEIAIMEGWLRDRGRAVPEIHLHGTEVMVHGTEHAADMPGMLSPEQMARMAAASGPGFDRLFLEGMIEHHRGAVTMVRELFATDGAGQDPIVFQFASEVQAEQTTEIARMERMLAAIAAGSPPR